MWEKIVAFFMSIVAFFSSLFGIGGTSANTDYVFKNLSYGSHERQVLDLRIPENSDGEVGLVLMIHGGAWIAGDKEGYSGGIKTACDELGYAGATINYRYLGKDVTMNDILDDIESALKVIKEKGAAVGVDINKVLLTGDSAGGHLSLLYAYSRSDTAPIKPVAVVSNSGPTDLADENFYINNSLGSEETIADLFSLCIGKDFSYADRAVYKEQLKAVSPLYYVNADTVPTVINHGMKDSIVPFSNAEALAAKLKEYGVKYDFNAYLNSDHDLGSDSENQKIANDLLFSYIKTYLGVEPGAKW
jgi:acetyl esterase/lipase